MSLTRNALLATALALSLGALLIALNPTAPTSAQSSECGVTGGTIVAAMSTNPPTLDPMLSTTTASRQVAVYIFESLVTYDETYAIIPQLAANWTSESNGLVYTFKLRSGVKF